MPIGGLNLPVDAAPVPIELNQIQVDHAIAKLAEQEEEEAAADDGKAQTTVDKDTVETDPNSANVPADDSNSDARLSSPQSKGVFKTTTHALRKTTSKKQTYKCGVCSAKKSSMQLLNTHHKCHHGPQMCGICGCVFNLATSLNRHMYSHDEQHFNCDKCDFTCHFKSELLTHKISHWKTPTHQCMTVNCGRWFKCKWELTIHVCTHEEGSFKCDECDYTAKIEKHLKEHKKRHMGDLPYHCKACDKRFKYCSGLK